MRDSGRYLSALSVSAYTSGVGYVLCLCILPESWLENSLLG